MVLTEHKGIKRVRCSLSTRVLRGSLSTKGLRGTQGQARFVQKENLSGRVSLSGAGWRNTDEVWHRLSLCLLESSCTSDPLATLEPERWSRRCECHRGQKKRKTGCRTCAYSCCLQQQAVVLVTDQLEDRNSNSEREEQGKARETQRGCISVDRVYVLERHVPD